MRRKSLLLRLQSSHTNTLHAATRQQQSLNRLSMRSHLSTNHAPTLWFLVSPRSFLRHPFSPPPLSHVHPVQPPLPSSPNPCFAAFISLSLAATSPLCNNRNKSFVLSLVVFADCVLIKLIDRQCPF